MRSMNIDGLIRSLTAMWEDELGDLPAPRSFNPCIWDEEKMTNLSVRPSEEDLPDGFHPMDFSYTDDMPAAYAAASAILVLRNWWLESESEWHRISSNGDVRRPLEDEVFETLRRDVESVIEELNAFRMRLNAVAEHTGDDVCAAAERVRDAKGKLCAEEALHAAAVYRARILEELHEHPIETLARVAEGT